MLDSLTHLVSGSPVTYAIVLLTATFDVLFPILPAETVLIGSAVIAAHGGLSIWLLVPAAAIGGFAGDNVSFVLGRRVGDPVARRLFRGERARGRLAWAERAVERHGTVLIVVARFLPGGRSGTTFAAGTLGVAWRRFAPADGAAALAWALYASMLGYVGGDSFQHSLWKPLALALAVGALLGAVGEGWRRLQRRRGRDILGDELPDRRTGDAPPARA
jgi:membrane protein DedA with SNARE-associated domain